MRKISERCGTETQLVYRYKLSQINKMTFLWLPINNISNFLMTLYNRNSKSMLNIHYQEYSEYIYHLEEIVTYRRNEQGRIWILSDQTQHLSKSVKNKHVHYYLQVHELSFYIHNLQLTAFKLNQLQHETELFLSQEQEQHTSNSSSNTTFASRPSH